MLLTASVLDETGGLFISLLADPTTGVTFTYMTNHFAGEPFHSQRLDRVANIIHAAID